jgi:hypothetical protein
VKGVRTYVLVFIVALLALTGTASARADEIAPDLEGSDLRVKAQTELKRLLARLAPNDQKRLVGVYVAFDTSMSDPIAQVACDDDGDYVVLLSDAMLRLVAHVARAESYDEPNGSRKIEEYAAFLARAQTPGRRLLPPPPGFYIAEKPAVDFEDRLGDVLAFVLAHELTRLRAGDLVCPRPTATKESGDEVWTSAEQRKAAEVAGSIYPGRALERDSEALARVRESGRTEKGALALARFFTQFDAERLMASGRFAPTYLAHHPNTAMRLANLKRAIEDQATAGD